VNRRIIIRPSAETDLSTAKAWYDKKHLGLGSEFLNEFSKSVAVLQVNPFAQPLYYRIFRRLIMRRFPYKIFYTVNEENIIIFRVLHVRMLHVTRLSNS